MTWTSIELRPLSAWARRRRTLRAAAAAAVLGGTLCMGLSFREASAEEARFGPVRRDIYGMRAEHAPLATPAPSATPPKTPDVIYVPTPQEVVDKMLDLVKPKKGELVYDLGCGDGRIVVSAAKKYGVKAVGFDIDPERIKEARENVRKNKVEHLVSIEQKDIFTLDLAPANIVTLYLLPTLNVRLIPQLEKLKAGSRVVSHDFDMRGVRPAKVVRLQPEGAHREHTVYLFGIPLDREGAPSKKTKALSLSPLL